MTKHIIFENDDIITSHKRAKISHWDKMAELHDNAWKSPLIGFKPDLKPVRTKMAQMLTIITEYWNTL
ncbi:MAG: hypothetical protein ACQEWV_17590 [Bacillota bacterium]